MESSGFSRSRWRVSSPSVVVAREPVPVTTAEEAGSIDEASSTASITRNTPALDFATLWPGEERFTVAESTEKSDESDEEDEDADDADVVADPDVVVVVDSPEYAVPSLPYELPDAYDRPLLPLLSLAAVDPRAVVVVVAVSEEESDEAVSEANNEDATPFRTGMGTPTGAGKRPACTSTAYI